AAATAAALASAAPVPEAPPPPPAAPADAIATPPASTPAKTASLGKAKGGKERAKDEGGEKKADKPAGGPAAANEKSAELAASAGDARSKSSGEAASFGMVGLLNGTAATTEDPMSARGNMWGDDIPSSGLTGIGEGAGGVGGRPDLGPIGTIGHGAGAGTGQGFGSGHGKRQDARGGAQKQGLKRPEPRVADGKPAFEVSAQLQQAIVGGVRDEMPTTFATHLHVDISHASVRCSAAAYAPFDERVALWRERLAGTGGNPVAIAGIYRRALGGCEAPTWRERGKLLSMLLDAMPSIPQKVALWRVMFTDLGAADALYRGILARVRTPADARVLHDALGLKAFDPALLEKMLKDAKSPEERVNKLRKLVDAWPDDFALALRLLDMLEDLGDDAAGRALAKKLRARPDADARLRTAVGEFYLRAASRAKDDGDKALDAAEAKRAFGEIVEFAPDDPVARRRLGDLLRAHGWFAEAERQYQTLARLSPEDPSVALLLAAADEGLGRLEEAVKWTEKGGAAGAPDVAQGPAVTARALASTYLAWGLDEARKHHKPDEEKAVAARLARVLATERTQKAELRGPRATLTWSHPELHASLWSNALGSPMPAPEGDVTLGVAQVLLPPR
ncbi:MAG TPA: tetratricopeptide repeat protein, partial [Byssovorax sp.]